MKHLTRCLAAVIVASLTFTAAAADEAPLKIALFSGSTEYKSNDSLAALKTLLESKYRCTCTLNLVDVTGEQGPTSCAGLQISQTLAERVAATTCQLLLAGH